MHEALVQIVTFTINERYVSEKAFYSNRLNIAPQSWDRWKKGQRGLKYDNMKILSTLFTDYEWMLVQKVIRQAETLPEVAQNPILEYTRLKIAVAKQWLKTDFCDIQWYQTETEDQVMRNHVMTLRLAFPSDYWGYEDIIELRLPGVTQRHIEATPVQLIEWLDENEVIMD